VFDGSVYIGAADGVYSLTAENGAVEWHAGTQSISCPVVTDDRVYISSFDTMHAFDRQTGEAQWTFTEAAEPDQASSLAFAEDRLVTLSSDGFVYCIDPETGAKLWQSPADETNDTKLGTPAISNGRVFVGDPAGTLSALSLADGKEHWRVETGERIISSPVVDSGTVYVGGDSLYAFDTQTGDQQFSVDVEGPIHASPIVTADTIVVTPNSRYAIAFDRRSREVLWERTFERELQGVLGAPIVSGNTVYRASTGGYLTAIDVETGETTFQVRHGNRMAGPTVNDETLYVLTQDNGGTLLALQG